MNILHFVKFIQMYYSKEYEKLFLQVNYTSRYTKKTLLRIVYLISFITYKRHRLL